MKSSIDSWSTSISTILAKTEKNLNIHRHSQPNLFSKGFQSSEDPKILLTEPQTNYFYSEDQPNISMQEFYQFKSYITERLTIQSLELDKIKRKLSLRERPSNEIDTVREDFNFSLSVMEKRCLGEIKKIMILLKGKEETCKKGSSQNGLNLKSELNSDGYLKVSDFHQNKESLFEEIEKAKKFAIEQVENFGALLANLKENMTQELKKVNEKVGISIKDFNLFVDENRIKIESLINQFKNIEKTQENFKFDEILSKTDKTSKKIQVLEEKLERYSNENIQPFRSPQVSEAFKSLSEKQDLIEQKLNEELLRLKENYPNTQNFALKKEVQLLKKQVKEKFRKSLNQASPVKPNEKISDSLITKLVQLEQRVSLLEDSSESESGVVENQKLFHESSSIEEMNKSRNYEKKEIKDFTIQIYKRFLDGEIGSCVQILTN